MKQTKQQRRAARARKRGRRRPPDGEWSARDLVEELDRVWWMAVFQRAAGAPLDLCVGSLVEWPAALADPVGDARVRELLTGLAGAGWTATDLHEVARRRLDPTLRDYVREQAPAPEVGLSRWAHEHGMGRAEALAAAVELLAAFGCLPRLAAATTEPTGGTDTVEERMLAKVRALLAKAESTEFDAEAEALTAAAQKVMSRYSLDAAMVAYAEGSAQRAGARRIWLDAPYVRAKALLADAVAAANRCRTVLAEEIGFLTVIGSPADLRTVELLSTSLLLQATRAMLSCGGGRSRPAATRTRSFRQSFLVAYAGRIAERLAEADASARAETDDARLLPVLAAGSRAVDAKFEELFPLTAPIGVSTGNGAGWAAGRAAADLALFEVDPLLDRARAG